MLLANSTCRTADAIVAHFIRAYIFIHAYTYITLPGWGNDKHSTYTLTETIGVTDIHFLIG
jgi:hypothetical protein